MRYEYQKLPQPEQGNPNYPATQRFSQDKNNFGPRLGFSYDVGGNHQTVVKGGFGLYYGRTSNSYIFSALTNNAVTFATYNFTPASAGAPIYPGVLAAPPTGPGAVPAISVLSPDMEQPEIWMGDFTLERSLGREFVVSASYLYSKGKKLPIFVDTNLPAPNAQVNYVVDGQSMGTFPFYRGARPDNRIGRSIEVRSEAESQYHGFVLQAQKRWGNGFMFNAQLHALQGHRQRPELHDVHLGQPERRGRDEPGRRRKATRNLDRRHRGVVSLFYAPSWLYGFQVAAIGTFESGLPLTPTISGGVAATTGATDASRTNGSGGDTRAPFRERNSDRQTGRQTIDARLSKAFKVGGSRQLVLLWEAFNVFNSTNYTFFSNIKYRVASSSYNAATNTTTVNLTEDTGYLVPTQASSTLFGPRDMQLGIKFLW